MGGIPNHFNPLKITESAGVTVSQGITTGILKTALQHEWTLAIVSQAITESVGVTVSQNEWTLTITSQDIEKSAGVTVTQRSGATAITGTLKTGLSGGTTTSLVISVASGVTFVSGVEVVIDDAIVVLGNVLTATKSFSATGTLKTALVGASATTSIVIKAVSGDIFLNSADVIIGDTTVLLANINTASNSGGTTSILIDSGYVNFDTSADIIIGSAVWTLAVASQGITESAGVIVTQGAVTGTLKTALQNEWTLAIAPQDVTEGIGVTVSQNEWTLAIASQDITESAGVAVTQGSGITVVTGTLKTALSGGTTTSIVISVASGVTFASGVEVVVGGTTVVLGSFTDSKTRIKTTQTIIRDTVSICTTCSSCYFACWMFIVVQKF